MYGEAGNDTLDGGAGSDLLDGATGNNTYLFGRGDGQDVVTSQSDNTAGKLNTVQFKAGVLPSEVVARRIYDGGYESLELSIVGTTDKLTVRYFFNANDPTSSLNAVQQVKFADGTTWDLAGIQAQAFAGSSSADSIAGTTLNDTINGQAGADALYGRTGDDVLNGDADADSLYGEAGNDTLDGGAGNDTLEGGVGNNTYLFGRGDGQDTVSAVNDSTAGKLSTVQFKAGVLPSEVVARRIYDGGYESLELSIVGTTDKLTVRYVFYGDNPTNAWNPVQQVKFADGTTWDLAGIKAQVFAGTSGADSIAGTTSNDSINGQAGADTLYGRTGDDLLNGGADADSLYGEPGNDTLDGGAGNDMLEGGVGNNTYLFGRGDGQDTVSAVNDGTAGKLSTVQFKAGVLPSEVVARRIYDGGYESLELSIVGTTDKLTVRYAFYGDNPASAWNPVQQVKFADGTTWDLTGIRAQVFAGTGGADSIAGTTGNDSINGQAGADTLYGRAGDDLLSGGADADSLYGEAGHDTLDGGAGNDYLEGAAGNNTYLFGRGDGQDVVYSQNDATAGKLNTVQFKAGVLPSEVVARRIADGGYESLELSIAGTTDKLTVRYFFGSNDPAGSWNPVQQVKFADGTTWDLASIKAQVFAGTSGADSIAGTTSNDVISGQAGTDTLYGRAGDDALTGGGDADSLFGEAGNDTLDGGAGNDYLDGSTGNNTYLFGRGDGQDVVYAASDATAGKLNTVQFKAGVLPSEVVARRFADGGYESLELSITGTTDKLTVRYFFGGNDPASSWNPVQQVKFADGTTWDLGAIKAQVFAGTSGADSIAGTIGNDSIHGQAGNDSLSGGQGNDSLDGGADADSLTGDAGSDTLDGGTGNDLLNGGAGPDTYRFERGFGVDTIQDYDTTAGTMDVVQFGGAQAILQSDVAFVRVVNDLEVRLSNSTDKLVLQSWYSGSAYHVEEFRFTDGTTLTDSQVQGLATAMAAFVPQAEAMSITSSTAEQRHPWSAMAISAQ